MLHRKENYSYPISFHQGNFVPWEETLIHADCASIRYGLSVFEGIRLYKQLDSEVMKPFALDTHLSRLKDSLKLMRMPNPGVESLPKIIEELIAKNNIVEDCYLRASVNATSLGIISEQVTTSMTVSAFKVARKKWLAEGKKMKISISKWQKTVDSSLPSTAKCTASYAGPRLALLEAMENGYDGTILTNNQGYLCEAPAYSLFIVKNGEVFTPPLDEGILPSVTRQTILDICRVLGIRASEGRLKATHAYLADEAFVCGTGIEFGPVASFDGYSLAQAEESPITNHLIEKFFKLVRGTSLS